MRKTKIIATIGPSCETPNDILKLIKHGVNIFRFNFKHNTLQWHKDKINLVKKIARREKKNIGTMIDLQGPQIRIYMPFDKIEVNRGEEILFDQNVFKVKKKGFFITHPHILKYIKHNTVFLVDDGRYIFHIEKSGGKLYAVSHQKAIIHNKKSINFPEIDFSIKSITKRDIEGIKTVRQCDIDFIALSFVRSKNDINSLAKLAEKFSIKAKIISKIETKKAIDNLDEIINHSEGIMVARGDLGVELPMEQVPYYQKMIVKKTIEKNKFVIIATQFLQSMIENKIPTRAEISDIANAVYDLTDSVMLSGETAYGNYPFESTKIIEKTLSFNEKLITQDIRKMVNIEIKSLQETVCASAYEMYLKFSQKEEKNLSGFLVFTQSGRTANILSRYRPKIPIFAVTPNEKVASSLSPLFGVFPMVYKTIAKTPVDNNSIRDIVLELYSKKMAKKGNKIIVLHGDIWGVEKGTSTVRIINIK